MWGEVCQIECPPQKVNLDTYLDAFYWCGLNCKKIAQMVGVSKAAVSKALKNFNVDAYSTERFRRKSENKEKRRQQDCERKNTPEARAKDRERKQCNRAKARRAENTYVKAVREALRDVEVKAVVGRVAKEMRIPRDDFYQLFLHSPDGHDVVLHPVPGIAKERVELMTKSEIRGRVIYEYQQLTSCTARVPGPSILGIHSLLKANDFYGAMEKAREALLEAGFISPHTIAEDVESSRSTVCGTLSENLLETLLTEAAEFGGVPDPPQLDEMDRHEALRQVARWRSQAKAAERDARATWRGGGGTGKAGKEGGKQNLGNAVAYSGIART